MPRAGPAMLSLWDVLGGDETAGPWLRRGGSRAACGGSRAGAWRGCGRWGSPPLFPVPGPAACLRAGGRLAPRGSLMTEPPWAAGGRLAEGWARKAYAVGFSGGRRDCGPLAEAGRKPCGLWGLGADTPGHRQCVCVTGGCGGRRGLGLWLILPGGLFRPVEIENNLKCRYWLERP